MNHPELLSDEEVQSTFFIVPPFAVGFVFGKANHKRFLAAHRTLARSGGDLLVIGWPDGTTMTYEALMAGDPIDLDCITEIYKATQALNRSFQR